MNEEVKTMWLDALRSGEYQQGKSYLRTGHNTFCCLGVLTDLAVKCGVIPEGRLTEGDGSLYYEYNDPNADTPDEAMNMLLSKVQEWSGITSNGGYFEDRVIDPRVKGSYAENLWELNDGLEWSFRQIADFIEEKF